MPTALHRELKERAEKLFPGDQVRQNAYVFGTLDKIAMQRKAKEKRESRT